MERNLKDLLLKFYDCSLFLETAPVELEELKRNPVEYDGGADIVQMQRVLDYQHQVADLHKGITNAKTHLKPITDDILDTLTSIGVMHDVRISLTREEFARLYLWYDIDACVNHELVM